MSLKDVLTLPEYKITLPSGKEVKYRPFVVKEEKILLIAKESKNNEQIYNCVKNIIKNCVIEPKNFNPDTLPYYDMEMLFVHLRCKSMGETVMIRVKDPETSEYFDTEINLEKIEVINLPKKQTKLKLNEGLAIQFKYPSFLEISKLTGLTSPDTAKTDVIELILSVSSLCIDKVYSKNETIDCSNLKQSEIIEFIDNLPQKEFQNFCEFFKTMPKLSYKSQFTNPKTGKTFPVEVTDFANFFIL